MPTALEYAVSFGRRKPGHTEVMELQRLREQDFAALVPKDVITLEDIQALEWGVKFEVANKLFDQCDAAAQHALLHDAHHGVRSAAALFKPSANPLRLNPPQRPTPSAPAPTVTIAAVTAIIMNGKEHMATLHGPKTAADIEEMIAATHPDLLLARVEDFIAGVKSEETKEIGDQLLRDLRSVRNMLR